MYKCKSCNNETKNRLSKGMCHNCYVYFYINKYDTWFPSQRGSISKVEAKDSPQYGMLICHICGKAYTKLQQHIYYCHHMTKNEYCDMFGLDHSIQLTTDEYNKKMHNYALTYKMDEQLKIVGKSTRFVEGHSISNYKRSEQTKKRLFKQATELGYIYGSENGKRSQEKRKIIREIYKFEENDRNQFIDELNKPIEELSTDQIRLKCLLLGYNIDKKIDFDKLTKGVINGKK